MEKCQKTPLHRQPPLGGSHDFHAGSGVVTGRSSDLQAWPIKMNGVSTGPSSRFQRKPVLFGRSILLTAAGQSRIRTGFPLGAPLGAPPANEAQDRGLLIPCQPKMSRFDPQYKDQAVVSKLKCPLFIAHEVSGLGWVSGPKPNVWCLRRLTAFLNFVVVGRAVSNATKQVPLDEGARRSSAQLVGFGIALASKSLELR